MFSTNWKNPVGNIKKEESLQCKENTYHCSVSPKFKSSLPKSAPNYLLPIHPHREFSINLWSKSLFTKPAHIL